MSSTCWWYPDSTVTPGLNPWAPDLNIYYLQYVSMDVLQTPQNLTYLKQIHLFLTPTLTHTISSPNLHKSKTALISQPKSDIHSSLFLTSQSQSFRKKIFPAQTAKYISNLQCLYSTAASPVQVSLLLTWTMKHLFHCRSRLCFHSPTFHSLWNS